MIEFGFVITDEQGVHARPAGLLVKEAAKFQSDIRLKKGDATADAKRIFSVMSLAAKQGERLTVVCSGEDEDEASEAIRVFLDKNL